MSIQNKVNNGINADVFEKLSTNYLSWLKTALEELMSDYPLGSIDGNKNSMPPKASSLNKLQLVWRDIRIALISLGIAFYALFAGYGAGSLGAAIVIIPLVGGGIVCLFYLFSAFHSGLAKLSKGDNYFFIGRNLLKKGNIGESSHAFALAVIYEGAYTDKNLDEVQRLCNHEQSELNELERKAIDYLSGILVYRSVSQGLFTVFIDDGILKYGLSIQRGWLADMNNEKLSSVRFLLRDSLKIAEVIHILRKDYPLIREKYKEGISEEGMQEVEEKDQQRHLA